jgi:hypothetical protein
MGKARAIICVVCLLVMTICATPSLSDSVVTPPTDAAQIQQGQPASGPDQQSSDHSEGTGAQVTSPGTDREGIAKSETTKTKTNNNSHPSEEWGLTLATWALVGVTALLFVAAGVQVGLFVWQLRLIRKSADDAAKAAHAASDQAQALVNSERAYIFAVVKFGDELPPDGKGDPAVTYEVELRNHGKTPAILKRLRLLVHMAAEYPATLPPAAIKKDIPPGKVLGAGAQYSTESTTRFNKADWTDIQNRKTKFLCLGEVIYLDMLGIERATYFCWELQPRGGLWRFDIAPTPASSPLNRYT